MLAPFDASKAAFERPSTSEHELLRLGLPGQATMVAEDAGVIGAIAWILLWVGAYLAYL